MQRNWGFCWVFFVCFVKSLINCIMLSVFRPGRLVEDDRSWLYSTDPWHMLLSLHSARLQQNLQRNVELFFLCFIPVAMPPKAQVIQGQQDPRVVSPHYNLCLLLHHEMQGKKTVCMPQAAKITTRPDPWRAEPGRKGVVKKRQHSAESSPETPARKARGLCVPWGKNSKGRTV